MRKDIDAWLAHRWFDRAFVFGMLGLAVAARVPTLRQPLLEAHGFRQTQTAYTSLIFRDEGISLLHSRLPVLGRPFEVPFELPLFQALGSLVMRAGPSPDLALRLTGLFWFLVTAVVLFAFVRRFAGRLAAGATLIVLLFGPYGIVWSRAALIEYMATAFAIAFVWAGVEWREQPRGRLAAAAMFFGTLACLVKVTTGVVYLLPLVAHRAARDSPRARGWLRARMSIPFGAMLVVPLAAASAWTAYADSIKRAHPSTSWLTSKALRDWNFGTLDQRLDPAQWSWVGQRVVDEQFGAGVVVYHVDSLVPWARGNWTVAIAALAVVSVSVPALLSTRNRALWIGWVLAGLAAIGVFFNLHLVHDYYQASVHPISATVVGITIAAAARRLWPRAGTALIGAASIAVAWLMTAYVGGDRSWERAYTHIGPSDERLATAARLSALTRPHELVVMLGYDWSPEILYYARRRGTMIGHWTPEPLERAPVLDGHTFLVSRDPWTDPIRVLAHWRWFAPVAPGMYRMAMSRQPIGKVAALGTFDGSVELAQRSWTRVFGARRLRCGPRWLALPSTRRELLVAVASSTPVSARIELEGSAAPFPGATVVIAPGTNARRLRCSGVPSVELSGVYESAP